MRRVTEQDLEPNGWVCESCADPFKVGDEAFGHPTGVTDSTPRDFEVMMSPEARAEVDDWDAPIPIFGDWQCRRCWDLERQQDFYSSLTVPRPPRGIR